MKNILSRNKAIARLLKEHRVQSGKTQKMVAAYLGCTNQFVAKWENAVCLPPEKAFRELIHYLDIPKVEVLQVLIEESRRYWERIL